MWRRRRRRVRGWTQTDSYCLQPCRAQFTTDIRLLSAGNSHLKYQTLLTPLVISTLPLYLILNAAYNSLWKCDISPFEACSDPAKDQSGVRLGMGGGLTFGNAIRDCLYVFVFVSNHLLVCFSVCLLQVGGGRLG